MNGDGSTGHAHVGPGLKLARAIHPLMQAFAKNRFAAILSRGGALRPIRERGVWLRQVGQRLEWRPTGHAI